MFTVLQHYVFQIMNFEQGEKQDKKRETDEINVHSSSLSSDEFDR